MVISHPISETFKYHIPYHRMVAVEGVATATEVIIFTSWSQHIINVIVKALKGDTRSHLVSFSCMVKYHIQKTLDTIVMKPLD